MLTHILSGPSTSVTTARKVVIDNRRFRGAGLHQQAGFLDKRLTIVAAYIELTVAATGHLRVISCHNYDGWTVLTNPMDNSHQVIISRKWNLHEVHNTYTTHTQHIHNTYTTHTQYIHNTYTIHTQYKHNTYTIHTQHTLWIQRAREEKLQAKRTGHTVSSSYNIYNRTLWRRGDVISWPMGTCEFKSLYHWASVYSCVLESATKYQDTWSPLCPVHIQ